MKIAVIGAAGGIGQPLSLLLARNRNVKQLSLYDLHGAKGVAADIGHVSRSVRVEGFAADSLNKAIEDADIIVCPAGVPRKPGMTRDDLFDKNAGVMRMLAKAVGESAPRAVTLVITNPVNSMVPLFDAAFKAKHNSTPRVLGVTTLDLVRAATFAGQDQNADVEVPVIGGHSGPTIVPVFSRMSRGRKLHGDVAKLVHRVQYGGDEVVQAKDGAGSATLSMAHAGAQFCESVIDSLDGRVQTVYTFAAVPESFAAELEKYGIAPEVARKVKFFSGKTKLRRGTPVEVTLPQLDESEQALLKKAVEQVIVDVDKGVQWAKANPAE